MKRLVITDCDFGSGEVEREILGPEFEIVLANVAAEDDVIASAADAVGLFVQWAPITARVLEALPRLRTVVRFGIGLDNIDTEAAGRRGVTVRNVANYCIDEVADHAVAMVSTVRRRLFDYDRAVKGGKWVLDAAPIPRPPDDEPVGIVGVGQIGRAVAERLAAQGHPILGWDPFLSDPPDGVRLVDDLRDLAAAVAHLTLHVPLTESTRGIIDGSVLEALGPSGHLVNTARGGLVDEAALLDVLDSKRLWRASVDVLGHEPPTGLSARLAMHPRVIATPHVAYLSRRSLLKLRVLAAEAMRDSLAD